MLTSIIKATRAHYAALQHKPSADRVALDYEVTGHTAGTIWVIARTNAQRSANLTKLSNRLQAMYPEAKHVECSYRRMPALCICTPVMNSFLGKNWKPQVLVQGEWAGNALVFATRDEALENARELMGRWMLVTDYRAGESTDAVNYKWANGQLEEV